MHTPELQAAVCELYEWARMFDETDKTKDRLVLAARIPEFAEKVAGLLVGAKDALEREEERVGVLTLQNRTIVEVNRKLSRAAMAVIAERDRARERVNELLNEGERQAAEIVNLSAHAAQLACDCDTNLAAAVKSDEYRKAAQDNAGVAIKAMEETVRLRAVLWGIAKQTGRWWQRGRCCARSRRSRGTRCKCGATAYEPARENVADDGARHARGPDAAGGLEERRVARRGADDPQRA
jgi:hypothetical protein